jgi:hypothetical protein
VGWGFADSLGGRPQGAAKSESLNAQRRDADGQDPKGGLSHATCIRVRQCSANVTRPPARGFINVEVERCPAWGAAAPKS